MFRSGLLLTQERSKGYCEVKLEDIKSPRDIKGLSLEELEELAVSVREKIIQTTSVCGGHIAPSLGVVELTIALHYVMNAPRDKIIWDVGHQAYTHKLLTGRADKFDKLRCRQGISGFPKRSESKYDAFGVGHASTSISAALGFAAARDFNGEDYDIAAVIGDGALTGGLAYEGLNNTGHLKKDMTVVLNDNKMFISKKVGAMGEYLTRILTSKSLSKFESKVTKTLQRHPSWGEEIIKFAKRSKAILTPGMLFQELGFSYFGPIDGHNIESLIDNLERLKEIDGPKILHVITRKGKGYKPAEEAPEVFHGTGVFDVATGKSPESSTEKYQDIFGDALCELADKNMKICAITAAMESGTGLNKFADKFPERFFDVGIAEQHAFTFAAALSCEGIIPVCAIYSTFIQRAYDQIIHDIALQDLPVIMALDRAGIVGKDGPTHHGNFDISFLTCIPNLTVMAPSNKKEMRDMLYSATIYNKPTAIRYPRGAADITESKTEFEMIERGKGVEAAEGRDLTVMALGNMVGPSLAAAKILKEEGIDIGVINLRFAKPLDKELIVKKAQETKKVLTVEENVIIGGIGEQIGGILAGELIPADISNLGLPDEFITYGEADSLRKEYGLSAEGIASRVRKLIKNRPES